MYDIIPSDLDLLGALVRGVVEVENLEEDGEPIGGTYVPAIDVIVLRAGLTEQERRQVAERLLDAVLARTTAEEAA